MEQEPKVHHNHHRHKSRARRSLSRATRTQDTTSSGSLQDILEIHQSPKQPKPINDKRSLDSHNSIIEQCGEGETEIGRFTNISHADTIINIVRSEPVDSQTVDSNDSNGMSMNSKPNIQTGIISYMDRELKTSTQNKQRLPISLSDPSASPAQRSSRSRNSVEKSPRRKRSKSESKRRRERKLIQAGELEVKQANETLMRYLKQCSELNDASLSGELEIDKNIEDRRVNRKTKSQRERRSHFHNVNVVGNVGAGSGSSVQSSGGINSGTYKGSSIRGKYSHGGLSGILKDLASDVVSMDSEIYNPFTPVISPTDGLPPTRIDKVFIQTSTGYRAVDSSYYKGSLDSELAGSNGLPIHNSVSLSCAVQRIWILIANVCHGLLGGLALAHLLYIWSVNRLVWNDVSDTILKQYATFTEYYANAFYILAIICVVSVFDRMDICRISKTTETISFKWIIICMIYLSTIILSLTAESVDKRIYMAHMNITNKSEETILQQIDKEERLNDFHVWNALSIARSICAICGWILIALSPRHDLLLDHLSEMDSYLISNNNNNNN